MLNFKRFGKSTLCLALCLICLLFANPVSALSTLTVPNNTVVPPQQPPVTLDAPTSQSQGHLVSYVRYSAYNGSTIIGCLEDGTVVTVLGSKNNFYKIDCYDMNGYIAKSQVAVNDAGEYYVKAVEGSRDTAYLPSYTVQEALELKSQVVQISQKYIGVPYVYGGTTPRGFDCSGLIQYVYKKAGVSLNRTACQQLSNTVIIAKEDLQPGDLVILSNTGGNGFASHTSLYLGNGKIIHAGTSRGVCIVDLDSSYFREHFQCARRIVVTDIAATATLPTIGSLTGNIGSDWRNEG